ncbi:hypothetical protein ACSRUE_39130 [Sorangium sp. KYC3313]
MTTCAGPAAHAELLRQQGQSAGGARGDLEALAEPALARVLATAH